MVLIVTLNTFYKAYAEAGSKVRIFTVCLVASAPAGISENVNVGSPESKALVNVSVAATSLHIVLAASLGGNCVTDFFEEVLVEGSRKADSLRENRSDTRSCNPVKSLIPPVVSADVKSVDGCCGMKCLRHLFFESHLTYERHGLCSVLSNLCVVLVDFHKNFLPNLFSLTFRHSEVGCRRILCVQIKLGRYKSGVLQKKGYLVNALLEVHLGSATATVAEYAL